MRLLSCLLAACALAGVFTSGCDRFADEEQVLDVRVLDADGAGVPRAEIHAVLSFSPPLPTSSPPPVAYRTEGQTNVSVEVIRRADAARVLTAEVGLVGAGTHTIPVDDLRLRNGLYDLRVMAGRTLLQQSPFVLNRAPLQDGQYPPAGVTSARGRATLAYDALSIGASVPGSVGEGVAYTVTDSLTLWVVAPGRTPRAFPLRLRPVGTTHATVTLE